ncbi:MAG: hypothetical protein VX985_02200, partial [SAR324 cluster bacterium]|nr:hypothetical protein [SAR324 cluster bacterium]
MSLLNRCSVQTEYIPTGSPGVSLFFCMVGKQLFPALWFSILFSLALILISLPIYSQESVGTKFEQSLEEDPLEESDADLGQEEDPLEESDTGLGQEEDPLEESDTDLGQEEDPLAESDTDLVLEEDPLAESDTDLGLEEDPLAESDTDLGLEEDPLAESDTDLGLEEDPLSESEAELGLDEDILEGESPEFEVLGKQEKEEQLVSEEEEEVFPPRVTFSHEVKTMFGASETKGLDVLDPLLSEI